MLYLTAHLVSADGGFATNAFLHDSNNELMGVMCDVRPGNNPVISYLDIWLPEPLRPQEILQSLTHAKQHLERDDSEIPFKLTTSGITVGFGCTIGVFKQRQYAAHFDRLATRAMLLANDPKHWSDVVPRAALQVTISQVDDIITYALTRESIDRLQKIHGADWIPKRVSVDQFDRMDIEALQGSLNSDLVQTITDIPLTHISKYGGIKFVNQGNGAIVWRYP
jgi:hypothetical protein